VRPASTSLPTHGLGRRGVGAGLTIVADGNAATTERLERVPDGDPGIRV